MKIRPLAKKVLVDTLKKGSRMIGGIIIPDDDGSDRGIRPRWGRIYAVGEGVDDLRPGQWILIEHGRGTREMKVDDTLSVYGVEYSSILAYQDEDPEDQIFNNMTALP